MMGWESGRLWLLADGMGHHGAGWTLWFQLPFWRPEGLWRAAWMRLQSHSCPAATDCRAGQTMMGWWDGMG